jgi:hypothetical protein
MDMLVYIAFIVAMLHFIYEGIVAPAIRISLDHRLFELRDELRCIKIDRGGEFSDEAYEIVDDGINMYIGRVGLVTASFIAWIRFQLQDENLRSQVKARAKVLEQANIPEISNIAIRATRVIENALACNSLPLIVVVLPFVLAMLVSSHLHRFVKRLFAIPMSKVEELIEHNSAVRMRA